MRDPFKTRVRKLPKVKIDKTVVKVMPPLSAEDQELQRTMPHNEWIWSVDSKPEYTSTEKYQLQTMFCKLWYELGHMGRAAFQIGVSMATLRGWMDTDPVFKKMLKNVEFAFNDDANYRLLMTIRNDDIDPRSANLASIATKNTYDPDFKGMKGKGGDIQVNVIMGPDPNRPPRLLSSTSDSEIVIPPDDDDER